MRLASSQVVAMTLAKRHGEIVCWQLREHDAASRELRKRDLDREWLGVYVPDGNARLAIGASKDVRGWSDREGGTVYLVAGEKRDQILSMLD